MLQQAAQQISGSADPGAAARAEPLLQRGAGLVQFGPGHKKEQHHQFAHQPTDIVPHTGQDTEKHNCQDQTDDGGCAAGMSSTIEKKNGQGHIDPWNGISEN
jgi:hypothetical protein